MTKQVFRRAEARDVTEAVPLIFSSGPAAYSQVFTAGGQTAEDFLSFAFSDGAGFCGYRNHSVFAADGRVLATVSLYTAADHGRLSRESLLQSTRFFGVTGTVRVVRQSLPVSRMMPTPPDDALYIANLAVHPDCRGGGLGSRILDLAAAQARALGLSRCCLDVAMTNGRAKALYFRHGFEAVSQRDWPASENPWEVPGHQRLVRRLA